MGLSLNTTKRNIPTMIEMMLPEPQNIQTNIFLTQLRDILINDIIKGTVSESEVEPKCDDVNKEQIFGGDITSLTNENICQAFAFIIENKGPTIWLTN